MHNEIMNSGTSTGIAYDRAGHREGLPVVLIHAGIADRRMWDDQWTTLAADHDVVRLDLRGFGDSDVRPGGPLDHVGDLTTALAEISIERCHLVGASFGAGVAVETALTHPGLIESLFLSAPGGSLIAEATPDLRQFIEAEDAALAQDDLDAAVEANLIWWVDGPHRGPDDVDPAIRDKVRAMQRRAFEVTADWDDVSEKEMDPPPFDRLSEIAAPTLVLAGALDLQCILNTADLVTEGIPATTAVSWPDVAHLPSMERSTDFLSLLQEWLSSLNSDSAS